MGWLPHPRVGSHPSHPGSNQGAVACDWEKSRVRERLMSHCPVTGGPRDNAGGYGLRRSSAASIRSSVAVKATRTWWLPAAP
ncbi:MAG: hypothetical protein JWO76_1944 [Nocardioides sp.]|nr:hypothetical protein [Nocardioides sp.]